MKAIVRYLLIIIMIYLFYGLSISFYRPHVMNKKLNPQESENFYDYKGIINVHSSMSTGVGGIQEIILEAQKAEVKFIFITDLNLPLKSREFSGYHDRLFVFIDGEYSYLDSRILYLNERAMETSFIDRPIQMVLANLLSQKHRPDKDGKLILAHPFKEGYQWRGEHPQGLDGIEIVNLKAIWKDAWLNTIWNFLWTLMVYPFNPDLAFIRLLTYPEKEIELWDKLSQKRKTLAVAGADAKSKFNFLKDHLNIPSYETLFGLVSNHILLKSELTGRTSKDRLKISQAISQGQFYMSFDILANPKGFNVFMSTENQSHIPMGSDVSLEKRPHLYVVLPQDLESPFEIIVYRNGKKYLSSDLTQISIPVHEPGVYRVFVRVRLTLPLPDGKRWIPWIFTNPFYVE